MGEIAAVSAMAYSGAVEIGGQLVLCAQDKGHRGLHQGDAFVHLIYTDVTTPGTATVSW